MNATQVSVYLVLLAVSIAVPWWLIVCRQDRDGVGERLLRRIAVLRIRAKRQRRAGG